MAKAKDRHYLQLARGAKLPSKPARVIAYSEGVGAARFKETRVGAMLAKVKVAGKQGLGFGRVVRTKGDRWNLRILVKARLVRVTE